MKKSLFIATYLLVIMSLVLGACGSNDAENGASSANSGNEASQSEGNAASDTGNDTVGGPPDGGEGRGAMGGMNQSIDTSSLVTDIAATINKESTADTSSCTTEGTTAQIACLAQAFEKTLTDDQISGLKYELTADNAAVWSNLPVTMAQRNGLMLGTLSAESVEAFKAMAAVALGDGGYETLKSLIMADEYLVTDTGNTMWDADFYYVAFLGEPSASEPWMLQIGGHHFAANLTYNTSTPGATPMFVAVEPLSFTMDGVTYTPLAARHDAVNNMIQSLNDTQLAAAKLSGTYDDVLAGPGQDNAFPASEGLSVSELNDEQKALVKAAIEAWVKDTNEEVYGELLEAYFSDEALNQTKLAWSGSTDFSVHGSYVRIDGPRVWIEFAVQNGIGYTDQIHYHTVWRDKVADYGGSFTG
ncbi:DUF3500 domain-containing protein [Paenibacillus tarimensis]